ncbi:PREDICTED: interleukin-10 [Tinamus guttatus]|uniref:interleukin-10 n=1 Tax=Tinamus guttatus TaxID=94827 RepID=UPI00052F20BD|nr:PREDICTED: interleukin-10 [Tinamus guttatus]
MQPCTALVLLLLAARCLHAEPSCTHFSELLPAYLRDLRIKFGEIKDYFQSKDNELGIQLLSSDLLNEFKGTFGCQAVSEAMRFYMEQVLPSASQASARHQESVSRLGNVLMNLKATMKRCHRFFTCEKHSKTLKRIRETFEKMNENGIYKAMGEFDIFINYIEEYLMMKGRK